METDELRKLLARASTPEERLEAVRQAVGAGVPLRRIEALLDWLDNALSDEISSLSGESHSTESTGPNPNPGCDGPGPGSDRPE